MIRLGEKIKSLRKQKNISARDLVDMLIIIGKYLKGIGETEKARSQFLIAQKIINAFSDDFVETKYFKAKVFETTDVELKEIEQLLCE